MNKPVYLGLSILEIIKIVMHEFWFHFVEPKYDEKAKLCYIDTDSLIVKILKKKLDTLNYELKRLLMKGKNKQVIGLMEIKLGGKLMNDGSENKKAKATKKCVIKKLKFEDYKNCLEAT